jgi:HK97 gp10 family phage protein
MIKLLWRGQRELYKSLVRIERNVEDSSKEFVRVAAEWLVNDIRSSWSGASPYNPGQPPAVDTGNLDKNVTSESQGRGEGGRFSKDVIAWFVRIDTAKGNGKGYSQALETGTSKMEARPFIMPAVDRLEAVYGELAKRNIRV